MNSSDNIEIKMVLSNGYAVPKELYAGAKKHLEEAIIVLAGNGCRGGFTVPWLFGEWWDEYDNSTRRAIGRCVADMVRSGALPLEFVGCPHKQPKEYYLK